MNRLVLQAVLIERGALRYTPAGLPAIDCRLKHESQVSEAGQPRRTSLEVRAVVIGPLSHQLEMLVLGSEATFAGFLASTRNGKGVVLHVTEIAFS